MAVRIPLRALSELSSDQECDTFALLSSKEELTTRDGKPYWMVSFRDARTEMTFPIWCDSTWAEACRTEWTVGMFYKLRAIRRETKYGPQLEIRRIREVIPQDHEEGFDPLMCLPQSRFPLEEMYSQLCDLVIEQVVSEPLRKLVLLILEKYRTPLLTLFAARYHHHAFVGGWLEHTLSVATLCVFLADRYRGLYPDMKPPLDRDLVIVGGILHDVGKLRELDCRPTATEYSPEGALIGHIVLGRDIVREWAEEAGLDRETQLRLEHLIISHQRLPEWGSPRPPMTPEALLVHYADDIDAKFYMYYHILQEDSSPGAVTNERNILRQRLFKGLPQSGLPQ